MNGRNEPEYAQTKTAYCLIQFQIICELLIEWFDQKRKLAVSELNGDETDGTNNKQISERAWY